MGEGPPPRVRSQIGARDQSTDTQPEAGRKRRRKMEGYTITTTTGAYLRETMRAATADTLDATMDAAAAYIGETAERETLDDGRVVQGSLVARPVSA